MKLITLIEDARYPQTTFTFEKRRYKARYAPAATCRALKPDELVVFLTRQAERNVLPDLRSALPEDLPLKIERIPAGSNPQQLWEIAQRLNQAVEEGDEVALDITHGPLSFPLVALMVIIFMRVARGIRIRGIFYGAYGIDKGVEEGTTPIFDLGEMLNWVEWFLAADRFVNAGDSGNLSSLLKEYRSMLARKAQGDPDILSQLGSLGKLAGVLENISQSLHMIRPYQAMTHIADLQERLEEALPLLEQPDNPLPTPILLERLKTVYLPMGLPDPESPKQASNTLEIERRLVNWYADREFWVDAVTLAREWLVSWMMLQFGLRDFTRNTARQRIESVLSAEAFDYKNSRKAGQTRQPIFLREIQDVEEVLSLWLELIEVRNDINHAGKRRNPSTPKNLVKRAGKCIDLINRLPLKGKSPLQTPAE